MAGPGYSENWREHSVETLLFYHTKGRGGCFYTMGQTLGGREEEKGFSEPFPTGIVENRNQWSVEVEFIPSVHWGVQAEFHTWSLDNADHVQGENRRDFRWRCGVWFYGDIKPKLGS